MKYFFLMIGLGLLGIFGFMYANSQLSVSLDATILESGAKTAIVYKTPTCGCCGIYTSYLEQLGFEVEVVNMDDLTPIKGQYGISTAMESCHTTIIGDYVIEGHMPGEAIEKLLQEQPNINGIALPGMPSGTPGMPGAKTETYEIYQLTDEGESLFLSL